MDAENKDNKKDIFEEIAVDVDNFIKLDPELQNKIVESIKENSEKENKRKNGKVAEIFGSNTQNISLYITALICIILLLIGLIYLFISPDKKNSENIEFWNLIIPVISLSLGYIFGKSKNND